MTVPLSPPLPRVPPRVPPAGDRPAGTLIAVAHGTRHPAGPAAIAELVARVGALRPGLRVLPAFAELAEPLLEDALDEAGRGGGPVVVVPLLLARGHHALIDIPGRARRWGAVTAPLGPDPLLAAALADRLGPLRDDDQVVLGAAGSSDPAGIADVATAARLLARRLRRPVPHGFVAAQGPALAEVVAGLRRRAGAGAGQGRVLVASYLLAPGLFHERMLACGADLTGAPLGAHDTVARLVLRRFDRACAQRAPATAGAGAATGAAATG